MKVVQGDLIRLAEQGHFDVIVHGCNQRQTWGAGIARQMAAAFPLAFEADRRAPERARQLGDISIGHVVWQESRFVEALGALLYTPHELYVVNAYTQIVPGRYDATRNRGINLVQNITTAMRHVKRRFTTMRIGYPKIGAGLAGGRWADIAEAIDRELAGEDHTLVEYALGAQ